MPAEQQEHQKLIDTDYYVEGYATTWERYNLYDDVYEQFSPNCLNGVDLSDVIMQYDHNGAVMARTKNSTLVVKSDEHGLFIAADLGKTEKSRQLYEEIKTGMCTKMSWSFIPDYDTVTFDENTRTVMHHDIKKIFDVSAVSIPANDTTDIFVRNFVDGEIGKIELERLERAKKIKTLNLKIKLEEI